MRCIKDQFFETIAIDPESPAANNLTAVNLIFGVKDLVFTRLIHCLTLVAFGAHVVLGCCVHHHHSDASAMCSHHTCDDGQGFDSHDHEHQHQHGASEQGPDEHEEDGHAPCDHSPQCDQGSCTFVVTESKSANFADGGVFTLVLPQSFSVDIRRSLAVNHSDRLLPGCHSAAQRCALQQSWQI